MSSFQPLRFLMLGVAAIAATASAQPKPTDPSPPVVSVPVPAPSTVGPPILIRPAASPPAPLAPRLASANDANRRFPLVVPSSPAWPAPMPLRALPSSPDWVGDDAYPPEAHRQEMEGQVMFETLVGVDGVPKACRILVPSPHVLLDDGTCDRAMTMRFQPPRDADGRATEAAYRARLTWLMSDPTMFAPALLRAELRLSGGEASDCRLTRTGGVPREWMRFACLTMIGERAHFLGEHLGKARRATILVELQPDGAAPMAGADAPGELTARRRTTFEVDRDGDIRGCRTVTDQGFGPRMLDYSGECGLFLTQSWLERGQGENSPGSGAIEIRVYIE